MFVHPTEAIQHRAEVIRSDGQHRRKAYGRVHRIASADPVPEAEHVCGVNSEPRHFCGIRGYSDKMLGHGLLIASYTIERPGARRMRVRHGFKRRKRLRGNHEEGLRSIEIADRLSEVSPVNVGHEAKREGAIAVKSQRFISHYRSQVGAADTDVDDVADALAGMSSPLAVPDAIGKIRHLVEHGVNLGYDVLAIH